MLSCEMLLFETGKTVWGERCEDVAFNSLPASMTSDLKALHYLTSPNMIQCDAKPKDPGLQNGGPMLLFDPHDHRCCQHNVSHGWPYFVEHLWAATDGNGLAALFYAPCSVKAKAGDGETVTIHEETEYPFGETVRFRLELQKPTHFPLTLRMPSWCKTPAMKINGRSESLSQGDYAIIDRKWSNGDVVELDLPMQVKVHKWAEQKNSVSVQRGPLTYSLGIGERVQRAGGTDAWPAFEILPTTPWNYALASDQFSVSRRGLKAGEQPFALENAPIEIHAKGRRVPGWKQDELGLVGLLPQSPVDTSEPMEDITLVPMGCARLRISMFPKAK